MGKLNLFTSNFNKFILSILLIVTIFGWVFNSFFEKNVIFSSEINGASKINRILVENHKEEIPIFGSSRAEGSYIPSALGENYYNYGISGTAAFIWLYLLEKELEKDKENDIIINFDLDGFLYSNGDIGNYIPNYPITKVLMLGDEKLYYNIPFVKYYGKFELYWKYYLNERMNLTKHTDNGGSFEKNQETEKRFRELVERRSKSSPVFLKDDSLMSKFNNLISSTDRKIHLIIAPYHSSYFVGFKNVEEVDNFLNQTNKKSNVTVIDLRNYINQDSLFMNTSHLNYEGAQIFSEKLKELFTTQDSR